MAALIRLTEAAEMPASLAASLTRRPAAISRRALSTFAFAIGGRPNLMLASRAAACPRRIRSRQFWRRWAASMALIADSGHRDQPIRPIVITQTGDRDHAAHLGRGGAWRAAWGGIGRHH